MKFKRNINGRNYEGFELSRSQIGSKSIAYNKIELPYTGKLPKTIEPHTAASIALAISPEKTSAVLMLSTDKRPYKYSLEATPEELDGIAWKFFFAEKRNAKTGERWSETRFNCGLSKYWLGRLQTEWLEWRRITLTPDKLSDECIEAILKRTSTSRLQKLVDHRK